MSTNVNNNKVVYVTCRLFQQDALYFTKPLSRALGVKRVTVFRDEMGILSEKISYITPKVQRPAILKFLLRIYQIVKLKDTNLALIAGIYEMPHGIIALIAGKILKKPTLISIIGNPAYRKVRKGIRKFLTDLALRRSNFITTTGSKSRQFLVSEGFPEEKLFILPNSIDTEHFHPLDSPKNYDIINLGRLSPEKRNFELLQVIADVKRHLPNIKVAIGGSGPEMSGLKDRIKQLDLEVNVDMVGYVKDDDLVAFLNSGKIFVMCSESEGFPRTIIQSVACGTPCIATNVGDISDLIIDGESGFLVDNVDEKEDFVRKILILLNDTSVYTKMRDRGLTLVREKYSEEAAVTFWNSILTRIEQ